MERASADCAQAEKKVTEKSAGPVLGQTETGRSQGSDGGPAGAPRPTAGLQATCTAPPPKTWRRGSGFPGSGGQQWAPAPLRTAGLLEQL